MQFVARVSPAVLTRSATAIAFPSVSDSHGTAMIVFFAALTVWRTPSAFSDATRATSVSFCRRQT